MKKKLFGCLKGYEKGQAFVLALILLAVGSLILVPLLGFMGDGLIASVIVENKTDELYDADAGVQDAIWKINHRDEISGVPLTMEDPDLVYSIPILNSEVDEEIDVIINYINPDNGGTYRVQSWVGDSWVDYETRIDAIIATVWLDFSGITDNVITSQSGWSLGGPATIDPPEGELGGPVGDYSGPWPTPEEIAAWYYRDVDDVEPYASDQLDIEDYVTTGLGPLYRDGTLNIINNGAAGLTLQLNGTIYVTGDTLIGTTNKAFTIDLNGQTIFIESDSVGPHNALEIGGKCTLIGSGCIIAVGDIKFEPNLNTSPDDYMLVMSVIGTNYMWPNGDFYGTLAGHADVNIQNGDAHYGNGPPEDGLNFPGGGGNMFWGIHTWEINWEY